MMTVSKSTKYFGYYKKKKRHIQAVIDFSALVHRANLHMKSLCPQLFNFAIDQEPAKINFASLVKLPPKEQSELNKRRIIQPLAKYF